MKVVSLLFIITMCLKILRSSSWRYSPDQSAVARSATDLLPHLHPTPHFDIKMLVLVAVKCIIIVSAPASMLCLWGQWDEGIVCRGCCRQIFWLILGLHLSHGHILAPLHRTRVHSIWAADWADHLQHFSQRPLQRRHSCSSHFSRPQSFQGVAYYLEQLNNFPSFSSPTGTSLFSSATQAKPTLVSLTFHHFTVEMS